MNTRHHHRVRAEVADGVARNRLAAIVLAAVLGVVGFLVATSTAHSANRSSATVSLRDDTRDGARHCGHTIYLFEKDRNDKSACTASCAQFWPPLLMFRF